MSLWTIKEGMDPVVNNGREIVRFLSCECGERTLVSYSSLNRAREFIKDRFLEYGLKAWEQSYRVGNHEVANIITELRGTLQPHRVIVVGAHYDTVEGSPGADDNATAVAALLEITRLWQDYRPPCTVRFVAFTLEEPPFFSTANMGSMRYARHCRDQEDDIFMMISLDMLGCAGKNIPQKVPPGITVPRRFHRGDFLAVVSLPSMAKAVYAWKNACNMAAGIDIIDIVAPASAGGMHLSDHYSFIQAGYPAIMLTDTAFYRNVNYHLPADTWDTVNYGFLAENIHGTSSALRNLAETAVR